MKINILQSKTQMTSPSQKTYIRDIPVLILVLYFAVGIGIQMIFGLDIFPPCLFSSIFDITCPGCGITRASVYLAKFDFLSAWNTNPLIYLIAPFFLVEIFKYFRSLNLRFFKK